MQDSTTSDMTGQCKVCLGSDVNFAFNTKILGKYPANLFECANCGFQYFPDARIWLEQAYATPIANTDTGIVRRSLNVHRIISSLLSFSNAQGKLLDWGSGSGLLVRLLRDDGHDCYGFEPYTVPVLAAGHTCNEETTVLLAHSYRAIVAIEVVEHLVDPAVFFQKALAHTDTLIFSTELFDRAKNSKDWCYYSTETGQHISFYTEKSLAHLAIVNGCFCSSDRRKSLHIMTRRSLDLGLFKWIAGYRRAHLVYLISKIFNKIVGRRSLLLLDHLEAKEILRSSQSSNSP